MHHIDHRHFSNNGRINHEKKNIRGRGKTSHNLFLDNVIYKDPTYAALARRAMKLVRAPLSESDRAAALMER